MSENDAELRPITIDFTMSIYCNLAKSQWNARERK